MAGGIGKIERYRSGGKSGAVRKRLVGAFGCVALVALAVLLLPGTAMASSLSVDFDAALSYFGLSPTTSDENANTILDSDEVALTAAILADTTNPHHNAVLAAYNTNRARMAIDHGYFDSPGTVLLTGYMTLGDANSVGYAVFAATIIGGLVNPANYDLTCASFLGADGNADVDSLTNTTEYAAIAGAGGPSSAKRATYLVNALSPATTDVLSITRADASPSNAPSVDFTVTFSAAVTGVDTSDFTLTTTGVTGASITSVSADSGATRTVTVNTGSGDGTIRLDVVDDDTIVAATSVPLGGTGAGNGNFASGEVYTLDKTAPTVTLSTTVTSPTDLDSIPVTITFSKPVTGFTEGGITVTNATIANFTGDGTTFTFDLVPTGDGHVTATVDAGVAQSATSLDNEAATAGIDIVHGIVPMPLVAWPMLIAVLAAALYALRPKKRPVK